MKAGALVIAALVLMLSGCTESDSSPHVVGTWRLSPERSGIATAALTLAIRADGTFSAEDLCNTIQGTWTARDVGVVLDDVNQSAVLCPDVQDVLRWSSWHAASVVDGTLQIPVDTTTLVYELL